MKHEAITAAWAARSKLLDESDKLYALGDERYDDGTKLSEEGGKHYSAAVAAKHGDKAVIDWATGEITIL